MVVVITMSQAFLLVTHILTDEILREFEKREEAAAHLGSSFILFHRANNAAVPARLRDYPFYSATEEHINTLGLKPLVKNKLVPGSNHFLLFDFASKHHFDHYWYIEYDVRFSGDWRIFFDSFSDASDDFVTSHIRRYEQEPDWAWWSSLKHNEIPFDTAKQLRSFNPIYKISQRALDHARLCHNDGWVGHHETLLPTLINYKFSVRDFGGSGEFVRRDQKELFYIDSADSKLSTGTMRFQNPHSWTFTQPRNKLIHPVKPDRIAKDLLRRGGLFDLVKSKINKLKTTTGDSA